MAEDAKDGPQDPNNMPKNSNDPTKPPNATNASNALMTALAPYAPHVAGAIIVVWLGMLLVLMFRVDVGDVAWARLVYLFGSMEAVAFTAVGAIFGTQVQRQRVAQAEQSADEAKKRATNAEGRATEAEKEKKASEVVAAKGKQLAAAVRAEARVMMAMGGGKLTEDSLPQAARALGDASRESLRLADELQ